MASLNDLMVRLSRVVLATGCVFIAFHPFTVSAHYCLWTKDGSSKYGDEGRNYPFATKEELRLSSVSIASAVSAGLFVGLH